MKPISDERRAKLDNERNLCNVPSGTRAVVHRIEAADAAIQRLMAMGLCVGRELEVVRQGNPLIVRMLGARIGVSGRVARHIIVDRS
jgi:Fe2+ transport system protein FeoA